MKKRLLVVALLGVAMFGSGALTTAADGTKPYTVSVTVKAAAQKGSFDCHVVVKDAKTGKEDFAPDLTVKVDDQSQASTINRDDLSLTCKIAIDKAGKEATYTFTAEQGDKAIQKDEGKVAIK